MTTSANAAAAIMATALSAQAAPPAVHHQSLEVQGVNVFYREAGPADAPTDCCCTASAPRLTCSAT